MSELFQKTVLSSLNQDMQDPGLPLLLPPRALGLVPASLPLAAAFVKLAEVLDPLDLVPGLLGCGALILGVLVSLVVLPGVAVPVCVPAPVILVLLLGVGKVNVSCARP